MSENKQRADIIATIRFPNQPEFLRRLTPEQAVDLGYQAPVSPAPPAWMVEEGAVGLTRIISASVLKEALRQAWDAGLATGASRAAQATASFPNDIERAHAVSAIIDTLPTREA